MSHKIIDTSSPNGLNEATKLLHDDGLIAFPADTVWGLACSSTSAKAIKRLKELKGRSDKHPFPLYAASTEHVWQVCSGENEVERKLAAEFWPGYLTMVLPLKNEKLLALASEDGKIGIRVPASPFLRTIVERLGHPLVNTSANPSGHPPFEELEDLLASMAPNLDAVLVSPEKPKGVASTVIRTNREGFEVLREGAISKSQLDGFLNLALKP